MLRSYLQTCYIDTKTGKVRTNWTEMNKTAICYTVEIIKTTTVFLKKTFRPKSNVSWSRPSSFFLLKRSNSSEKRNFLSKRMLLSEEKSQRKPINMANIIIKCFEVASSHRNMTSSSRWSKKRQPFLPFIVTAIELGNQLLSPKVLI